MQGKALVPIFSCLVLLAALAACAKTETAPASGPAASAGSSSASASPPAKAQEVVVRSSTDVVKASAAPLELAAGGSADLSVKVQITKGYHINANPPTFAYLKATELSVEAVEGLSAGKPVYPPSVTKPFNFAEKPLAVYEGETEIKLPLRAAGSAAKGTRTLPLSLRVQACDDKACYPPGTLGIPVGLTIK